MECIRSAAGPHGAILFVHGILGAPDFFSFLIPDIPRDWALFTITLDGHCATPRDFGAASMKRWKAQVSEAASDLKSRFVRLVIVAHSMGTLFAIEQGVCGNADALFLLNPPLALRPSKRLFLTPIKVYTGRIRPDDVWTNAAVEAYSISDDANPLHYLCWPKRYLELFNEIRKTRPLVCRLTIPVTAIYSVLDEMVSPRSAKLFESLSSATLLLLEESGHYYYTPSDKETIKTALDYSLRSNFLPRGVR